MLWPKATMTDAQQKQIWWNGFGCFYKQTIAAQAGWMRKDSSASYSPLLLNGLAALMFCQWDKFYVIDHFFEFNWDADNIMTCCYGISRYWRTYVANLFFCSQHDHVKGTNELFWALLIITIVLSKTDLIHFVLWVLVTKSDLIQVNIFVSTA